LADLGAQERKASSSWECLMTSMSPPAAEPSHGCPSSGELAASTCEDHHALRWTRKRNS
jgi:hypothetical protein